MSTDGKIATKKHKRLKRAGGEFFNHSEHRERRGREGEALKAFSELGIRRHKGTKGEKIGV